jgi:hypothetical protein
MIRQFITFTTLTGALLAFAVPARAETTQCMQITTLPATLSTSGMYCLGKNLSTSLSSGNAITIAASNITIDCNDRSLVGTAPRASTRANGLYALDRYNLTVRHCDIRGFARGVSLEGNSTGGHRIEDNTVSDSANFGIYAKGDNVLARRNRVNNTGGGTNAGTISIGMLLDGSSVGVTGNTISRVYSTRVSAESAGAQGIRVLGGPGLTISDNRVLDLGPVTDTQLVSGISVLGGFINSQQIRAQALIERNEVVAHQGSQGYPVQVNSATEHDASCRDNVLLGFGIFGMRNCVDSGGNIRK